MIRLSPSLIALYFHYECPRYLIYRSSSDIQKKVTGRHDFISVHSPVTRAIMRGGYLWEEEVVENKLKKKALIAPKEKSNKTRDRVFEVDDTLRSLRNIKNGEYLYQGTLETPVSFYKEYGIDRKEISFSNCRPDLIECFYEDGKKYLGIIDVKASARLKTSHKIQVTFYALLLQNILKTEKIDSDACLKSGKIWLYNEEEPGLFDSGLIIPHINQLLYEDIKKFSQTAPEELPWHLNPRCENCEFFLFCKEEAHTKKSISLMPHLSIAAKKYLSSGNVNVHTINDLGKLLKKKDAADILSRSASLSGKKNKLTAQLKSLLSEEIGIFGNSSLQMPVWEDIRIILSAERDPLTGEIYALGYYRFGGKEIFEKITEQKYFIAESQKDCPAIKEKFILSLYDILYEIHEYNEGQDEWKDKKSVQVYVFETYECELLNEVLLEQLKNSKTAEAALALLFYFQSETLFHADDHPGVEASFPVIVLLNVIKELFALPVSVSYTLKSVHELLKDENSKLTYSGSKTFNFELSNILKSEPLFYAWYEGQTENLIKIEKEFKQRTWAKNDIIQGIRTKAIHPETGKSILFAYPPKFFFSDSAGFHNKVFSKLSFIVRYDKIIDFLEIRNNRSLSIDEKLENGLIFKAKALQTNGNRFEIESSEFDSELDGFGWLLTLDDEEGHRHQMAFNDYQNKIARWTPKNFYGFVAFLDGIEKVGDKLNITLDLKNGKSSPKIEKGHIYIIQKRFTDYTSSRILKHIRRLDEANDFRVVQLITEPEKFFKVLKDIQNVDTVVKSVNRKSGLAPSQKEALAHFLRYNLSLIWGPPGTGKTFFIAIAVLTLLEQYRLSGKKCHVFITAFTHAAIENCLAKIKEVNDKYKIWQKDEVGIYKLDKLQSSEKFSSLDIISNDYLHGYMNDYDRAVFGGTIFAMGKILENYECSFDLIVVDEASQLKVPDSIIPLSLGSTICRYLIVGDDKQLPPIIKGAYPEPEEGEARLHRSIFEVIRQKDIKGKITSQLYENFRMNEVLCKYPAKAIYSERYNSFNERIANRKISLARFVKDKDLISYIINPDYPLVVCIFDGIITGPENKTEAGIVSEIAKYLRNELCMNGTGKRYKADEEGDKLFWREGLFIVSPHHLQINAIKKALKEYGLREPYFVDTVDKMQGQECETVIVSYGVSDPEKAEQEGEFIYSLNRLNVSLTRATSKTIVFLSKQLLSPTLKVLENEQTAEGISFMAGLEEFCTTGEKKVFSFSETGDETITIHRMKST